jgi:ERCC4-type nuclease
MLVSPAERPPFNTLGDVSSVPEMYGSDFLIHSPVFGLVGVQRKELSDLVASLSDDRLSREVFQMKECDVGIWLLEGVPSWSSEGQLMSSRVQFTQSQLEGLTFSLMSQGFWILSSASVQDSMRLLSVLEKWLQKTSHSTLNRRSSAKGVFGAPDKREQQIHFLMGLPGVGYDRSSAILDTFPDFPVQLKPGVNLASVPGIGKKIAQRIEEFFNG